MGPGTADRPSFAISTSSLQVKVREMMLVGCIAGMTGDDSSKTAESIGTFYASYNSQYVFQSNSGACYLVQSVVVQDSKPVDWNNRFIWPPVPGIPANLDPTTFAQNPSIEYGKAQSRPFTWLSNMSYMRIDMVQEQSPALAKSRLITSCRPNAGGNNTDLLYWDGNIGEIDLKLTNIVFLMATDCNNTNTRRIFSHYFNLTKAADIPSTTSTSTQSNQSTLPTTTSPSSSSNAASPDAGSTSNVAILAGGMGGGIGGALLLIAALFACWKYKKSNKTKHPYDPPHYQTLSGFGPGMTPDIRSQNTSPAYSYRHQPYQSSSYAPTEHMSSFNYPRDAARQKVPQYPVELSAMSNDRHHTSEL